MKKKPKLHADPDGLGEYDLSKGVRGKYTRRTGPRSKAIAIQPDSSPTNVSDTWDVLEHFAGTVDAQPDWSSEHDHYLYGTPKRKSDKSDG